MAKRLVSLKMGSVSRTQVLDEMVWMPLGKAWIHFSPTPASYKTLNSKPDVVIYEALCFNLSQGRMNGAPDETRTHSCKFSSLCHILSMAEGLGKYIVRFIFTFLCVVKHLHSYIKYSYLILIILWFQVFLI